MKHTVLPLTPERWPDLEAIFNAKGCSVARGCWCMYYRRSGTRGSLPRGTTRAQANRAELKALVITDSIARLSLNEYIGKRAVLKGCGDVDVPATAYVAASARLRRANWI